MIDWLIGLPCYADRDREKNFDSRKCGDCIAGTTIWTDCFQLRQELDDGEIEQAPGDPEDLWRECEYGGEFINEVIASILFPPWLKEQRK